MPSDSYLRSGGKRYTVKTRIALDQAELFIKSNPGKSVCYASTDRMVTLRTAEDVQQLRNKLLGHLDATR